MRSTIAAITYHLPDKVETNADLADEYPGWDMALVASKSGILSRHIADKEETAADLAFHAAKKLLAEHPNAQGDIDFLLYCTQSPDHYLPPAACQLQTRLGLGTHTGALDFNLGCSGYVYGLSLAHGLIATGAAKKVLLLNSDTYSKYIHPGDRTVRAIFGDGAAATLVTPTCDAELGLGRFVFGTDGRGAENLIVPSGGMRCPRSPDTAVSYTDENGCIRSNDSLYMNGKAIFAFSITCVPKVVKKLLTATNTPPEAIDWYVFHQANQYMLQNIAARCGIGPDKMAVEFADTGNTVSASIPIVLRRYQDKGLLTRGAKLLLVGFGVGYSWAANLMDWSL